MSFSVTTLCIIERKRLLYVLYVHNKSVKTFYFLRAEVQNRLHQDQDYPCEVVGSWNTWYGEQDQAGKEQSSSKQKTWWKDNEVSPLSDHGHCLHRGLNCFLGGFFAFQGLINGTPYSEWLQFRCICCAEHHRIMCRHTQALPDESPPLPLLLYMIIYSV